jgi:hypothetical protein
MSEKDDDLATRIDQFRTFSLPGQPISMHMGTSYLVNDLWREVMKLRLDNANLTDDNDLLRKQLDEAKQYMNHKPTCLRFTGGWMRMWECDCGFVDLLNRMKK